MSFNIKEYKWPLLLILTGIILLMVVIAIELIPSNINSDKASKAAGDIKVALIGVFSAFTGIMQIAVTKLFRKYTNQTRNTINNALGDVPEDLDILTHAILKIGNRLDVIDKQADKKHAENKAQYEELKHIIEADKKDNNTLHQEHRIRLEKLESTQKGVLESLFKIENKLDCG